MSSTQKPVPRLDLAPKLNRPLSWKNILDYGILLRWIFVFPQALRWYTETFGSRFRLSLKSNFKDGAIFIYKNPIHFNLWLQGIILLILIPIFLGISLYSLGISNNWNLLGLYTSLGFFLVFFLGVAYSVEMGIAFSVSLTLSMSISFILKNNILIFLFNVEKYNNFFELLIVVLYNIIIEGSAIGIAFGLAFNIILSFVFSLSSKKVNDIKYIYSQQEINQHIDESRHFVNMNKIFMLFFLCGSLIFIIVNFINGYLEEIILLIIKLVIILIGILTTLIFFTRPEIWLFYLINKKTINNKHLFFPHVTLIPVPGLSKQLVNWLQQDLKIGIHNINQLLAYTLQIIPVIQAINQFLIIIPEDQVIYQVSKLAENPYSWRFVIYSASASLLDTLNFFLPSTRTRMDLPYRAAAAGFWYLYRKDLDKSIESFTRVRFLLYGDELLILAKVLLILYNTRSINDINNCQLPNLNKNFCLRLNSWKSINSLYKIVEDVNLIKNSVSLSTRSLALNRALGKIKGILDQSETLPEAERGLIVDIAQNWQSALLGITEEVGKTSMTKKVINPYIIGDPVIGKQFIGREDIIKQLEELWVSTPQLQSVVLFGHRRMGKTSILRNISTRLDEQVKLAYVNLLTVGNSIQGVGEVLMAIADSLSNTLQIPPPDDDSLINLPYPTFNRYLKQIETQLGDTGLIIALDEFEQIEELIKSDRIPKDFMGVLRGMVQMSPKIAFALAGLHTLEEMTEDYFNPFFASIIPIRVSFLERATCRYLLANPSEDFPLDYKPDALDYIYDLTAGQPYLVQLIGFLLVRRYNDQVFELGNKRDPMFTIADVDGIINQPEFYQNGRYYFTGVWQQAGEGSPGQQNIIKAIAPHPTGLDFNTLQTITNLDPNSLQNALDTLSRHDVIIETDNHWRIIVELFRRWVINSVKLNLLT